MDIARTFPEPWRSMIAASSWVDETVSFVLLRRRHAKKAMWQEGTSSRGIVEGNVAWLKTALHSLSHPKSDFRRLVEFLGETVPKPGVIRSDADPG